MFDGGGGHETQPDERVDPVGGGGHGNLTVVGIRIAGRRFVHHHDVFARPQRREPGPVRGGRNRIDDRAVGAVANAQRMQSQPHRAIVSRCEQQNTRDEQSGHLDELQADVGPVRA